MKSRIARGAALLLAAAIIPSCSENDSWDWYWTDGEVRVTVDNRESAPVDVVAETWTWWDEDLERINLRVSSLEALQLSFDFGNVEFLYVRIYRSAGGGKIFDGVWDRDEIYDAEGRIRITVGP